MSADTTNRGTCPVCYRAVRLTPAGKLARHMTPPTMIGPARDCTGSGRPPEVPPEVPNE